MKTSLFVTITIHFESKSPGIVVFSTLVIGLALALTAQTPALPEPNQELLQAAHL
jgi:hypothetical protein